MPHSVEEYIKHFGGSDRTYRASDTSVEMRLYERTAVLAKIRPGEGQALIQIGACQIHGKPEDLEVVGAAFTYAAAAIRGRVAQDAADKEQLTTAPQLCTTCEGVHTADERCAQIGVDTLRADAYKRMETTHCLSRKQAHLLVDSAAMWVAAGDVAAARMLLHMYVLDDVVRQVTDILQEVHSREVPWLPPMQSAEDPLRPWLATTRIAQPSSAAFPVDPQAPVSEWPPPTVNGATHPEG